MTPVLTGVLPALILGSVVMKAHGAPLSLPAMNVLAAVIGSLVVLLVGKRLAAFLTERSAWVALAVLGLEALTLAAPGIDGVHRWVSLSSVRLHPSAIGDPILLLAVVVLWVRGRRWTATSFVATGLALHAMQPDAGQAAALASGALVLTLVRGPRLGERIAISAVAVSGAVLAWLRPDPLPPVDFVENIVRMAFDLHPLMGAATVVSLAALPASALWRSREDSTRWAHGLRWPNIAMALYLLASVLVVVFGEFPIPVLGFGASPIVGAILGLGLLNPVRLQILRKPTAGEPLPTR